VLVLAIPVLVLEYVLCEVRLVAANTKR
jgi:hypothetical protein